MYIKELKLYTTQLNAQIEFYSHVLNLNFKLIKQTSSEVSYRIGQSILTFKYKEHAKPYHFAINIPAGKHIEALEWLKQRVDILIEDQIEIHDFKSWNAKAIYFYDADKNIVEFISRNNLKQYSDTSFSSDSILEISEIGVPTRNIKTFYDHLSQITPFRVYDGEFKRFCAIGDEYGLFICIDINKGWFPKGDPSFMADFSIAFKHKKQLFQFNIKNGRIEY